MPTDLKKATGVDYVNNLIGDKIRVKIDYGNDNIGNPYIPRAWFAGSRAGENLAKFTDAGNAFVGDATAAKVNQAMRAFVGLFANVCRKRMIVYYITDSYSYAVYDATGIGNFANGPAVDGMTASGLLKGADITTLTFTQMCEQLYNDWWNKAGNPVVETLTTSYCHSSCHSSCHTDCHSNVPACHSNEPTCHSNTPPCHSNEPPCHSNVPSCHTNVCHSDCHTNCHNNRGRR